MNDSADRSAAIVRAARPDDASAIAAVHVRSWQAAYRGIVPDEILDGLSVDRRAGHWRETIQARGDDRVWVVERHAEIVGFAATSPARDDDVGSGTGEVQAIYLDPAAWSTGLGRRLFGAAVDDLRSRGFDPLVLWVLTANERGRRFYEAAGWRPDGTSRVLDFSGTPIEEVRYRDGAHGGTNGLPGPTTVGG